tara:strand:- start:5027 stop:5488 length:462 start_codon:yes stop_codon:yes gene_type:complete
LEKTIRDVNNLEKRMKQMSTVRKDSTLALPENLSQLEGPEMEKMYKLISVLKTGSASGWEKVKMLFIKGQMKLPNKEKAGDINAALVSKVASKNLSQEDIIMNDMNIDTNAVIESISDGTVDLDSGAEELEKMKMLDGDMPGQGKHKQGNWRG